MLVLFVVVRASGTKVTKQLRKLVNKMDVFLMIRRKKTTIFTDAKENTKILEVKKIIEGIANVKPEDQKLCSEDGTYVYSDDKTLADYSITAQNGRAHSPASIGLCFKDEDGKFEDLVIAPLSSPPELPEVMKFQDPQPHDLV